VKVKYIFADLTLIFI